MLRQRRGVFVVEAQLLENGVDNREATLLSSRTHFVPFENIGEPPVTIGVSGKISFWIMVVGALLSLLFFVQEYQSPGDASSWEGPLVISAVAALFHLHSRRTFVVFPGRAPELFLLKDKPDGRQFERFVEEMRVRRNAYLLERYPPREHDTLLDELERLEALRKREALSEEEFRRLKHDLLGPEAPERKIGF